MKSLDEMHLSLVLPGLGGFDGPAFPGEGHVPALILAVLEGCVVVLQDNLCEDTVSASPTGLRNRKTHEVSSSVSSTRVYSLFSVLDCTFYCRLL